MLNPTHERVRILDDAGRVALLVDGVVQSVRVADAPDGYWWQMLPDVRPGRALLLGAGGGTLAALLTQRFGLIDLVGVDDDPDVLALGRRAFHLGLPNLDLILADAVQFALNCPGRFDYVAVDLYHGASYPRAITNRPFLSALRRLASPGGVIVFNLFRDKRLPAEEQRVARVLRVVRRIPVGKNLVLHCKAG